MSDNSPGSDRIYYKHIKTIDNTGRILSYMFNKCREGQRIPNMWKTAYTVLYVSIYLLPIKIQNENGCEANQTRYTPTCLITMIKLVLNYDLKVISCTGHPKQPPTSKQKTNWRHEAKWPSPDNPGKPKYTVPSRQNQQELSNSVQTAATQFKKRNQVQNPHIALYCSCGDLSTFWKIKPLQNHWGKRK